MTDTTKAALNELHAAFELGLNAASCQQPERIDLAIEKFNAAAALLRANAAVVPSMWHSPGLGEVHSECHRHMIYCETDGIVDDDLARRVCDHLAAPSAPVLAEPHLTVIDTNDWEPCTPEFLSNGGVCCARARLWNEATRNHWHPKRQQPVQGGGDADVYREYFAAHTEMLLAKQASEDATRANIVGFMTPSRGVHAEPYETTVARNADLKKRADEAREKYNAAKDRFTTAKRAALALPPAQPAPKDQDARAWTEELTVAWSSLALDAMACLARVEAGRATAGECLRELRPRVAANREATRLALVKARAQPHGIASPQAGGGEKA